ncbi:MAG TPA: inositol oxygenase family protein [Pirellulales bacterium]|jgi:inositol oxygenase
MVDKSSPHDANPLASLDEWEDDLKRRYPEPEVEAVPEGVVHAEGTKKSAKEFRNHRESARPSVREFYRLNHRYQTLDFVRQKRDEYFALKKREMSIWEALEYLNTLVDDSDPDTDFSQIEHCLQTAEAVRRDGHPRWFILAALIHDLGKILCLYGEPQWAVVGDTFPVGCAYSDEIVFAEFFADNPDRDVAEYRTKTGIYSERCGLDNVMMSWGHDEYMYHVAKNYLPEEGLYMLRYHSCYPIHREKQYGHLMNEHDEKIFRWVRKFSPYDLYTKSAERPDVEKLRPFYEDLAAEFFPDKVRW